MYERIVYDIYLQLSRISRRCEYLQIVETISHLNIQKVPFCILFLPVVLGWVPGLLGPELPGPVEL